MAASRDRDDPAPTAPAADGAPAANNAPAADDADLTYEVARTELAEVMSSLESGGQSLEESLALWRRGEDLADLCQRWLDDAGRRLDEAIAARSEPTPPA